MPGSAPPPFTIARLIRIPAAVTLAVTLLRLVGELLHWSPVWFNPAAGGGLSPVGIVWLAPVFGIYFALRLAAAGAGPERLGRAIGYALLGAAVFFALPFLATQLQYPAVLLVVWALAAAAALLQLKPWPALFKTVLAYGLAARIPVAIVIFFAFLGDWHTHYDALPPGFKSKNLWSTYLWMGLFPQLIAWVAFTIVSATLFGTVATALWRRFARPRQPAPAE
jgi:hypothetical protein